MKIIEWVLLHFANHVRVRKNRWKFSAICRLSPQEKEEKSNNHGINTPASLHWIRIIIKQEIQILIHTNLSPCNARNNS